MSTSDVFGVVLCLLVIRTVWAYVTYTDCLRAKTALYRLHHRH